MIDEVEVRNRAAHQMVSDLCHGRRKWFMSIPARRDYDPDLVIDASLRDVPKLLQQNARLKHLLSMYHSPGWGCTHGGKCDVCEALGADRTPPVYAQTPVVAECLEPCHLGADCGCDPPGG